MKKYINDVTAEGDNMNGTTKQKRGKGYIRLFIIGVSMVLILRAVIGIGKNTPVTALVGYGDIVIAESTSGVIVRTEKVIRAPISGNVTYAVREGVRVPINSKLLEVKKCEVGSDITVRYEEINERLKALQLLVDNTLIPATENGAINESLSRIAFLINEGNLASVYYEKETLKREINYYLAANTTQSEREELLRKKAELDEIIEGGIKTETAPISGVPVYSLDGYEEVLCPCNIKEIEPSNVAPVNVKRVDLAKEMKAGDPVMKIVDNHTWYFVCQLSKCFAESFRQGSVVNLRYSKEENKGVRAKVDYLAEQNDGMLVVFQSKDCFEGLFDARIIDVTVVKGKYSGLMVPFSAIIEKEGGYRIEVLDADKTIEKDIMIKGHDGVNAVIDNKDTQSGIKLYDRVVLKNAREGLHENQ